MNQTTMEIELEKHTGAYQPGEEIRGRVNWFLGPQVGSVELHLFWFTKGKGTQDIEIVDSSNFAVTGGAGNAPFSFTAPSVPYSFSGKLISLIWALELLDKSTNQVVRKEIVIAPNGEEVELGTVDESSRKPFFQRTR